MNLLSNIKAAQLQARKNRNAEATATLTTLLGDAVMVGKNDGGRESTDSEVMAVIKKFIKGVDENIRIIQEQTTSQQSVLETLMAERVLLESFLPQQLSEAELRDEVELLIAEVGAAGPKDIGKVMKPLKERFDGRFDGNLASAAIKVALGNLGA